MPAPPHPATTSKSIIHGPGHTLLLQKYNQEYNEYKTLSNKINLEIIQLKVTANSWLDCLPEHAHT